MSAAPAETGHLAGSIGRAVLASLHPPRRPRACARRVKSSLSWSKHPPGSLCVCHLDDSDVDHCGASGCSLLDCAGFAAAEDVPTATPTTARFTSTKPARRWSPQCASWAGTSQATVVRAADARDLGQLPQVGDSFSSSASTTGCQPCMSSGVAQLLSQRGKSSLPAGVKS